MISSRHVKFAVVKPVVLLLLLLVTGCGFSLRSSQQLTSQLPVLRLNLQQPGSDLSAQVQRGLRSAGVQVELSDLATVNGAPVLSMDAERFESRPVTVNPRAQAAQYSMQISVTISLNGPGGVILEPDTLVVERLFFENIETISGNLEEMEVIRTEMRRELVDQLMRRLSAVTASGSR